MCTPYESLEPLRSNLYVLRPTEAVLQLFKGTNDFLVRATRPLQVLEAKSVAQTALLRSNVAVAQAEAQLDAAGAQVTNRY